jgi:macrocin-O-methyltransferase TylF-like protien
MMTQSADESALQLYRRKDREHWQELESLVKENNIALSEMLVNFPAFVRRREMTRLLADYDLFRMIVDLPGSIVELGVYLGAGLLTWSKLLETFVPGDRSRKVYGFESGGGYQDFSFEDGDPRPWIDTIGQKTVSRNYLERLTELTNQDNMVRGVERCRVIFGNISETVPEFARNSQGTRFSLMFLDVNLYKPTLIGLRELYPLLLRGGIVAINGFGSPPWQGEALALEHYFREISAPHPRLRKLPYSIRPGAYFIKGLD